LKTRRYQADDERMILTALIVHDGVLGKVHRHFGGEYDRPFRSKWTNIVAGWCFKYFDKYGKAPRRSIEGLFAHYAQSAKDRQAVELVEAYLSGLDADYRTLAKGINEDFLVDKASIYFTKIRLERTLEATQSFLDTNEVEEASKTYAAYEKIDFATNSWSGFDQEKVKDSFRSREQEERLVEFPGALDIFLSPHFKRGGFIAFAGPDKRGKSYWLGEVAYRALRQRRRVLYYVLGDMSLDEVYQRMCQRMTRRPLVAQVIQVPKQIKASYKDGPLVRRESKKCKAMTLSDVSKARKELLALTASNEVKIKIKCEGGSVVSAGDIEQDVKRFSNEDFVPDVVVVDYADLLMAEPHTKHLDLRHQNHATWMILRRIALTYHCLVVVATQTAATAYHAKIIKKDDFSEDKRKNAHVTGMIGINQTDKEKEQGLYRLNWIVLRGGRWSERQVVWTAGELAIACPCLVSALPARKGADDEEEE
jgi:hypothetical protein